MYVFVHRCLYCINFRNYSNEAVNAAVTCHITNALPTIIGASAATLSNKAITCKCC